MEHTEIAQTIPTRTFKDVNTDFVQMLGNALGTPENPDFDKVMRLMSILTELGTNNPVFLRKIFSPEMMTKIAEVAPELKGKSKLEFMAMALPLVNQFTEIYKNA